MAMYQHRIVGIAVTVLLLGACSGAPAGSNVGAGSPTADTAGRDSSVISAPPSEVASPRGIHTPRAALSPTPSPRGPGWTLATIPGADHIAATANRVASHDGGLIATGRYQCTRTVVDGMPEIGMCYGLAWLSATGATWSRIEPAPAIEVGDALPMSGEDPGWVVAAGNAVGTVLLGYRWYSEPNASAGATIWLLRDDSTFTPVVDASFRSAWWSDVVATDRGFLAVGTVADYRFGSDVWPPPRAAAWWSTDGRTWTRAGDGRWADIGGYLRTLDQPLFGGPLAATATDHGFVTVGTSCDEDGGSCAAAAWTSPDGLAWGRLPIPGRSDRLHAVAANDDHLVALGTRSDCGRDCRTDVLVRDAAAGWASSSITRPLDHLAPTPRGFIAVGIDSDGAPVAAWSADGSDWAERRDLPDLPGLRVKAIDVTVVDGLAVIVGWAGHRDPARDAGFAMVGNADP